MLDILINQIAKQLDLNSQYITEDTNIDELGMDSLETSELVIDLEDNLGITIPDDFPISGEMTLGEIAENLKELRC